MHVLLYLISTFYEISILEDSRTAVSDGAFADETISKFDPLNPHMSLHILNTGLHTVLVSTSEENLFKNQDFTLAYHFLSSCDLYAGLSI